MKCHATQRIVVNDTSSMWPCPFLSFSLRCWGSFLSLSLSLALFPLLPSLSFHLAANYRCLSFSSKTFIDRKPGRESNALEKSSLKSETEQRCTLLAPMDSRSRNSVITSSHRNESSISTKEIVRRDAQCSINLKSGTKINIF